MKRTPLARKTPMARKPMKRKATHKRSAEARWRSEPYLDWVRSQPCSLCSSTPCDAHHVIGLGWGLSGMGMTAPDSYAMPLCRTCHGDMHRLPELQRQQPAFLRRTLSQGIEQFSGEAKAGLLRALAFVDAKDVL